MVAKRSSDQERLESSILSLLPDDGTPVLNRVMRVMLARELERAIDEDAFFAARDALMARGAVGRLRGQGGQIFLTRPDSAGDAESKAAAPKEKWSESKLMAPLRIYLEGAFRKSLDLPASGACIVQDTSVMGASKGKWARPDFILVSAMRFKLMPGAQVDLHSFELKTETGGSVLAIHEALAQTRFTHFGHFVWHLPVGAKAETLLKDITVHCEEHGIGLIRMKDPAKPLQEDAFEILVDARRKATLAIDVEDFLMSRLNDAQKDELMRAVRGDS